MSKIGKAAMKVLSVNQLENLVRLGKAPKGIVRFDKYKNSYEIAHVHFDNGSALYMNGKWRHGSKVLTNTEKEFLKKHGWQLPE